MPTVSRTFTVTTPPDRVFAYLSDFTNTTTWDPGTVETTRISGDGGLGTRYHNVSSFLGKKTELTYETTRYDAPQAFEVTGQNDTATTKDQLTFTPHGAGTEVTYTAIFTFKGLIGKLPDVLFRLPLDRLADKTVAQLKDSLEKL